MNDPIYEAASTATGRHTQIGTRFSSPREVQIPLRETLRRFVAALPELKWDRTKMVFDPVYPGQRGYDEAPYEMSVIWQDDVMKLPL